MTNWFKYLVVLALFAAMGCESDKGTTKNIGFKIKPLISVSDLILLQQKGVDVVFVDVRPRKDFRKGHITGARNVWRNQIQDTANYEYGGMMATKAQLEKLFSNLGIKYGDYIVMYDAKGQVDAARLWWILKVYGYKNMSLLDGGLRAWETQNINLGKVKKRKFTKTEFVFERDIDSSLLADKRMVESAIKSQVLLVDCRSDDEFNGSEKKKGAYRAGHIPGAIQVDYHNCINMEEGSEDFCKLKSKKKLKEIYASKGIKKKDSIVIYCHSGVRSAHSTFVLTQILGYKNVKNYDGSWIEWSYFEDLPIEGIN